MNTRARTVMLLSFGAALWGGCTANTDDAGAPPVVAAPSDEEPEASSEEESTDDAAPATRDAGKPKKDAGKPPTPSDAGTEDPDSGSCWPFPCATDAGVVDAAVKDSAPPACNMILIGGGEPTLYPGFAPMVEFCKGLGLQVAVVSNGSRNDRILAAAPFFTKGDWVRLSLDAGSNEVFRRMHNPSSKTLSLDEICGWIPKIKAVNPDLQVGFSFVITWNGGSRGAVKVVENIH